MNNNFLQKILGDKKEWRMMQTRAAALPSDYQIVYSEVQNYMWKFTAGDGLVIVAILKDLLDLFQTGAADGKRVLDVTGEDVAAFCDELLRNARTYTGKWRKSLQPRRDGQFPGKGGRTMMDVAIVTENLTKAFKEIRCHCRSRSR